MTTLLIAIALGAFILWGVFAYLGRRERKKAEPPTERYAWTPPAHYSRPRRHYSTSAVPQSRSSSDSDYLTPMVAGMLLANATNSRAGESRSMSSDSYSGGGGTFDGGGASSSWSPSDSCSSSSSDSGSSYDSGSSSSDSGSSCSSTD